MEGDCTLTNSVRISRWRAMVCVRATPPPVVSVPSIASCRLLHVVVAPQHTPHRTASATWPSSVHRTAPHLLPAAGALTALCLT
jgi:hypothetical protein